MLTQRVGVLVFAGGKNVLVCLTETCGTGRMVYGLFALTAAAEIAGCYAVWAWARMDKSALWLLPGGVLLALFAYLLTLVPTEAAGRAYAAYGGIYVAASILWLWLAEGSRPDRWDMIGSAVCILGTLIILFPSRN